VSARCAHAASVHRRTHRCAPTRQPNTSGTFVGSRLASTADRTSEPGPRFAVNVCTGTFAHRRCGPRRSFMHFQTPSRASAKRSGVQGHCPCVGPLRTCRFRAQAHTQVRPYKGTGQSHPHQNPKRLCYRSQKPLTLADTLHPTQSGGSSRGRYRPRWKTAARARFHSARAAPAGAQAPDRA